MRKLIVGLVALFLVVGVTSCSSSGSDDGDASKKTTTTAKPSGGKDTTTTAADETTTTEGSSGGGDDYVAGLAEGLAGGNEDDGDLVLAQDEADCVAERWIDVIGVKRLEAQDVTAKDLADPDFTYSDLDLSKSEGETMIDAFGACDVDIRTKLLDSLGADLDADQKSCLEENLDEDFQKALLVEALVTEEFSDELNTKMQDLQTTCNLG